MKTVLMVGNSPRVKGGITTVITQYREHDWEKDNISLKFIPTYIDKNNLIKILFFLIAYIKILFEIIFNRPDIIHIHMSYKGSFTRAKRIAKLAKKYNIKFIVHLHGSEFKKWFESCDKNKKDQIRELLRDSYKFIVLGNEWKKIIEKIEPKTNIIVLNNSISIPNETTKWNENEFNILFLGVLIKRKGVSDLLQAIYHLVQNKKIGKARVFIAGTGEEENSLKDECTKLRIEEFVRFTGWLGSKDKEDLLKKSQLMILPSYNEGLPMSILEAMSYGIPIIATDVGDIKEVVKDNINGYTFKPGDIDTLANIMDKEIHIEKNIWKQQSNNSRKIIEHNFNIEKEMLKIINIYKDMKIEK